MNPILEWFASESWGRFVEALLHTLWIGAVAAGMVAGMLRRTTDCFQRSRLCVGALASILVGGLVMWAVLEQKASGPSGLNRVERSSTELAKVQAPTLESATARPDSVPRRAAGGASSLPTLNWLALVWLAGAALMMARTVWLVAAAEQVRCTGRTVRSGPVFQLVEEARIELGVARRIQLVVTERLCSPAVIGVFAPAIIFPVSLMTSLPIEQVRLILLHELAHIRRGDYLVNVFQLVAESVLFFNPAVWWMSRLIRREREACCDALAAGLAERRVDYAQALATVAEVAARRIPGAPAFGERRRGSGLTDRIQRLVAPGYRPSARLNWPTLLVSTLLGGTLLLLSTFATRWTVQAAAILLSPQQRIERIEKRMTELGQAPVAPSEGDEQITVRGLARTRDGSPVPRDAAGVFFSRSRNSSHHSACGRDGEGFFHARVPRGRTYFSVHAAGFAPAWAEPVSTAGTNAPPLFEVTLDRGFTVRVQVKDSETEQPISGAELKPAFWLPGSGKNGPVPLVLTADQSGTVALSNCVQLPLTIAVENPGYETSETRFERVSPGDLLIVETRRALATSGSVRDQATGDPVRDAGIYLLRAEGVSGLNQTDPRNPSSPLAITDERGRFTIQALPRAGRFWLLVDRAGYAQTILPDVRAGQTELAVRLGPELVVRGRITGDLSRLEQERGGPVIKRMVTYQLGDSGNSRIDSIPVEVEDGVGKFEFTQPIAGPVEVTAANEVFSREITESVDDWVLKLRNPDDASKTRPVVLRFETGSRVPPKGTVYVYLPDLKPNSTRRKELEIQDGEVRFDMLLDRTPLSFEPAQTVGYWFAREYGITIPDGDGPYIIEKPVVPAGAIYARARNADGSPAADVLFSIVETKKSPLASAQWPRTPSGDSYTTGEGPRQYVATPLPLDGAYMVVAKRENDFCTSQSITLTAAAPDQNVELQFAPCTSISGQVLNPDGRPVRDPAIEGAWERIEGHSHGLSPVRGDDQGRFIIENATPAFGKYTLLVRSPGLQTARVTVDFNRLPLVIQLEPGLTLVGRVVNAGTGSPLAGAEVRAMDSSFKRPQETVETDQTGRFEFTTLHPASYRFAVNGNYFGNLPPVRAGATEPVLLELAR